MLKKIINKFPTLLGGQGVSEIGKIPYFFFFYLNPSLNPNKSLNLMSYVEGCGCLSMHASPFICTFSMSIQTYPY